MTMTTIDHDSFDPDTIRQTVHRSALLLDAEVHRWWDHIDIDQLDMNQSTLCIVGQLRGADVISRDRFEDMDQHRGFWIDQPDEHGNFGTALLELRDCWMSEVTDRIEMFGGPTVKVYRLVLSATVEAANEAEAWRVAGNLLAGQPTEQGHEAAPVTGPGSWAPDIRVADVIA